MQESLVQIQSPRPSSEGGEISASMFAILLVVAAYLIGSIPVGVLIGRMFGIDPRAVGSRNIGMTNVARAAGRGAAILTFIGDLSKGAMPVLAARVSGTDTTTLAVVALAAFFGSIFSASGCPSASVAITSPSRIAPRSSSGA